MTMNANAPTQAPSIRVSPPMTAITSSSIVAARPMLPGAICPCHQTKRTPDEGGDERGEAESERPVQRHVVTQ